MAKNKNRICPVEKAGCLDGKLRTFVHNPEMILAPYIEEGMKVLEIGCGPGFFVPAMAKLVGFSGQVIACDLQSGMLEKVKNKLKNTIFERNIIYHQCESNSLNIDMKVDFLLLFWMAHEVTDKERFFKEIQSFLHKNGKILIVEPYIHVSKKAFRKTINEALNLGLIELKSQRIFFSRAAVLQNPG